MAMLRILWPFAAGVIVCFTGKFFGAPLVDVMILRRRIHQELLILSKVKLIGMDFYLYQDKSRVLDDARRNIREFGSRLSALTTSLHQPLPFILGKLSYDFDGAAANLLQLSVEADDRAQTLARRQVEIALRLPLSEESDEGSSALAGGVLPNTSARDRIAAMNALPAGRPGVADGGRHSDLR
jgi:hypothetical protein